MPSLPSMLISDFDYPLKDEQIAKYQLDDRSAAKLLVYKSGEIIHANFREIVNHLPSHSLLVFNNTKVIPARLHFSKTTGALIELFLLKPLAPFAELSLAMAATSTVVWECMIGNKKKWKGEELSQELHIAGRKVNLSVKLLDTETNLVALSWNEASLTFAEIVKAAGEIPLPPYLNRETEQSDIENYQTVYAKIDGAVAAPTAGLHFTQDIIDNLAQQHSFDYVTLHVGAGTFQPVKTENALEHIMHEEEVNFTLAFIKKLAVYNYPVIPVGTTSARSLESLYWYGVKLAEDKNASFDISQKYPYEGGGAKNLSVTESLTNIIEKLEKEAKSSLSGKTSIMIFPGYQYRICKGLITNFHQPKSTLLLLVSALIGDRWRQVYEQALTQNYRFLSYGDSSLLLP